ncbi:S-adenosylmethionine-dependent methyltransferase Rv2258c-like [Glandiceps talaboti]
MQLSNTTFSVHDIASLPLDWSGKFDIIFCINVIHDIARPDLALKEVYRILKDEGVFFMVDVRGHTKHADNKEDKKAPSKYIISLFSCVPISMACEGGWGLGGMWGVEKAMEMLEEAGLECKDTQLYSTSNIVYQCKKKQQ